MHNKFSHDYDDGHGDDGAARLCTDANNPTVQPAQPTRLVEGLGECVVKIEQKRRSMFES